MEWGPRALGNRIDPRRSAPRRHEGDPQRARSSAASRSARSRRRSSTKRSPNGSKRTTHVPFMMQVFQIRAGQAAAHPGRHPRRRLRAAADRHRAHQPALLPADRRLPRRSPACRCCSTRRSTRTSRSCASREGGARLLPAHQDGHAGHGPRGFVPRECQLKSSCERQRGGLDRLASKRCGFQPFQFYPL